MLLPEQVTWLECRGASAEFTEVRRSLGDERFEEWRTSLKTFLCDYFSAEPHCTRKQGKSISPVASGIKKGKGLKVRFGYPGCGKSGGLRLGVLAFCDERTVKFAGAWRRREDPDDDDFKKSFEEHAQ